MPPGSESTSGASFRLVLTAEGYRIKADVSLPAGQVRPTDLLPVYRELSEAVCKVAIEREAAAGATLSCQKGCGACCKRQYVETTEAEAYRLAQVLEGLPEAHRARVEARFARNRIVLDEAALFEPMMSYNVRSEARPAWVRQFPHLGIACPFLEDGACSIYEERPLVCREYLVTSPPEACDHPDLDGLRRIQLPASTLGPAMRMFPSVDGDARLVPLAVLRDWLDRNPEPSDRTGALELLARSFDGAGFGLETEDVEPGPRSVNTSAGLPNAPNQEAGVLVPEYEVPDALLVPHYGITSIDLLEHIATAAAEHVGVILLSPDPEATRKFIATQPDPARFSHLIAASDTAWIHDRAPVAVRRADGRITWHLPRWPGDERRADAALFESISVHPMEPTLLHLARGNLIAGPGGLALSTRQLLAENAQPSATPLREGARQLGIRRWIVFTPFTHELTHHADVHVRFLSETLAAVAWNRSLARDRTLAEDLERQLRDAVPGLRVLRIPIRSQTSRYASLLNWIQLGTALLIPHFELTPEEDLLETRELLEALGFKLQFIESPTLESGGSLHCLTAPVYLSPNGEG